MANKSVKLTLSSGASVEIPLTTDGNREVARVLIDNVPYHFERLKKADMVRKYRVDDDPSYKPLSDSYSYCCTLSPYSK